MSQESEMDTFLCISLPDVIIRFGALRRYAVQKI